MKITKSGDSVGSMQLEMERGDEPLRLGGLKLDLSDMTIQIDRVPSRERRSPGSRPITWLTRKITITAEWWHDGDQVRSGITTKITLTPQQYAQICETILQGQSRIEVKDTMQEIPVAEVARQDRLL